MSCRDKLAGPDDLLATIRNSNGCFRINWNYQIYASQNKLKAEKRIDIWVRHTIRDENDKHSYPLWRRHYLAVCDMNWKAWYLDEDGLKQPLHFDAPGQDKLTIVDDTIVFNGGFLKIEDPGLTGPLTALGLADLLDPIQASKYELDCEPFTYEGGERHFEQIGRNIHIESEFQEISSKEMQPIFYFPQVDFWFPTGDVESPCEEEYPGYDAGIVFFGALNEPKKVNNDQLNVRRLYWTISKMDYTSTPFELGGTNDRHLISVTQDSDLLSKAFSQSPEEQNNLATTPYFEMMVDSIGLGHKYIPLSVEEGDKPAQQRTGRPNIGLNTIGDHEFAIDRRCFYVGFAPENSNPELTDWGNQVFYGKIHRIIFDPHSPCGSC